MLSAIPDFLQTAFADPIKNFFQPAFVTVASIFVFLNIIIIFPLLNAYHVTLAIMFFSQNAAIQALILVVVVLVLAYLLLSLNTFVMKLMTGQLWNRSLLGLMFTKLQINVRNQLLSNNKRSIPDQSQWVFTKLLNNNKRSIPDQLQAELDEVTSFPTDNDYIGPTSLGNVLSATASYIWRHYHIDMTALWPHMENVVATENTNLSARIANEKAVLDFLVSCSFILILFSLEFVLTQTFFQTGTQVLWVGVPLVFAFIVYRASVLQARNWGDEVEIAFDMHRSDLQKKLGIRDFTDEDDERQVWEKVSRWLLWSVPADDVFAGQSTSSYTPSTPDVTSSANAKVDVRSSTRDAETADNVELDELIKNGQRIQSIYQCVDYVLLISNTDAKCVDHVLLISNTDASGNTCKVQGVYVLVSDVQVPIIYNDNPQATGFIDTEVKFHSKVIHTSDPNLQDEILWNIEGLATNGSTALCYSLPSSIFRATLLKADQGIQLETPGQDTPDEDTQAIDYTFTIKNNGTTNSNQVTLEVIDTRRSLPGIDKFGCVIDTQGNTTIIKASKRSMPDRYIWTINSVPQSSSVELQYTL